jgi:hypothetical protein
MGTDPDNEFTDYQKVIEDTENVILCVAKAEIMVRKIGKSLLESQTETAKQAAAPVDIRGTDDE